MPTCPDQRSYIITSLVSPWFDRSERELKLDSRYYQFCQFFSSSDFVPKNQSLIGVFLGFIGSSLVLGLDLGKDIPILGLIATIIALIAITLSTIWQKKISNNLPLSVSNFY